MNDSSTFREVMAPFAAAIAPLAVALDGLPAGRSRLRTALTGAVAQLVRKGHDAVLPDIRPAAASAAARLVAEEFAVDLIRLTYGKEPRGGVDGKTKRIYLEHITPLGMLTAQFQLSPEPAAILDILDLELHAAWITKEEQQLIDRRHKPQRPIPREIFRELGIDVDPWPG